MPVTILCHNVVMALWFYLIVSFLESLFSLILVSPSCPISMGFQYVLRYPVLPHWYWLRVSSLDGKESGLFFRAHDLVLVDVVANIF